MEMNRLIIKHSVRFLLFALFAGSLFLPTACLSDGRHLQVHIEKADGSSSPEFSVELSTTPGQRALGLMYRRELKENNGMLFIFPDAAERSFWMKNTYVALDILFFGSDFRLVSAVENATPLSEAPRNSVKPAQYVLEISSGSVSRLKISEGDKLVVKGTLPRAE